jgi:hypothetical protein
MLLPLLGMRHCFFFVVDDPPNDGHIPGPVEEDDDHDEDEDDEDEDVKHEPFFWSSPEDAY